MNALGKIGLSLFSLVIAWFLLIGVLYCFIHFTTQVGYNTVEAGQAH